MGLSPNENAHQKESTTSFEGPSHVFYDIPPRLLPLLYTLPSEHTLLPENVVIESNNKPDLLHVKIANSGRWQFLNSYDHTDVTSKDFTSQEFDYQTITIPGQEPLSFQDMYSKRAELLDAFLAETVGPKKENVHMYRALRADEWKQVQEKGYYTVLERTNFENDNTFNTESSQVRLYSHQTQPKGWDEIAYAGIILRATVDPRMYVDVLGTVPRTENRYAHFLTQDQLEYSEDQGQTWKPLEISQPQE